MSILVIEDSIDIQELLIELIKEKLGKHATISASFFEARKELLKGRFDLIILDYQLPDANGEDILNYIRDNNIDTPTIIFSASDDISLEVKSPLIYIIKDKSISRLFAYIKKLKYE